MHIKTICWHCGFVNNRQASVEGDDMKPKDGNVSLCFQCGAPAIFDFSLEDNIRKPTPTEMDELMADEKIVKALWVLSKARGKRK